MNIYFYIQMLKIGCGSEEEHAILLACWLLGLQVPAMLVLGTALPEGLKSAFVLARFDDGTTALINASDGNCNFLNLENLTTRNSFRMLVFHKRSDLSTHFTRVCGNRRKRICKCAKG